MMDAGELARLQADLAALLPDRCDLLTVTRTSDGAGGWSESWATAAANVPCRFDPLRGSEALVGAALQSRQVYTVTLPAGTTLTTASRLKRGTTSYAVLAVDGVKSWAGTLRAVVEAL